MARGMARDRARGRARLLNLERPVMRILGGHIALTTLKLGSLGGSLALLEQEQLEGLDLGQEEGLVDLSWVIGLNI